MCFYCGSRTIIKYGVKSQKQRYLCKSCGKQFVFRQKVDTQGLWHDYIFGKQTVKQLSEKHRLSPSTIRRRLSEQRSMRIISSSKRVVVLMDTVYWGRNFGVVVFKDWRTRRILWRKFVRYETVADYNEGIEWLEENGFQIDGVVCDGLRGMFGMLSKYRVQMCQFHQITIVRRYLTRNPILPAAMELKAIIDNITHTDKESFEGDFMEWEARWRDFLNERHIDSEGKRRYVHRRLRSAGLSVRRNMQYLWTWYDYYEVGIPNTNNALEGQFADLKTKLRNHNGLSKAKRKVFIDEYFRKTFLTIK